MQIISPIQQNILELWGEPQGSTDFYLTGGTALSYFYLKHRKSNDLDFFTPSEGIIPDFSNRLEKNLAEKGFVVERRRGLDSFVELFVQKDKQSTIIQLAQDSAFRFEPTKTFPGYPNLRVDNLTDIATNKLLALFGRAALRDFIDVYILVDKGHFRREDLLEKAKEKDPGFDLYWFGIALGRIETFLENSSEMALLIEPMPFEKMSSFFSQWRADVAKEIPS